MYIFDTNAFNTLGNYYPKRFPTIWERVDRMVDDGKLWSVKEVLNELERYCPFPYISDWAKQHRKIFRNPSEEEQRIVLEIFKRPQFQGFIRKQNLLKGWPVADPFLVAAGKAYNAYVVTQEDRAKDGAKVPTACVEFGVKYLNVEGFLEKEEIKL